ncbi:MAG: hypothetical protein ACR2PL_17935 [Dehalococcoidia bacterium]
MNDLPASDVHFDGLGASAGDGAEAARVLAARLTHWSSDHPNSRILQFTVQSTAAAAGVELSAIIVYTEELGITPVAIATVADELPRDATDIVIEAEEIVADAQQEPT